MKRLRSGIIPVIIVTVLMLAIPIQSVMALSLGDRTLRMGDRGYDVQQLQRDLGYLGYSVGAADGIFGWNTFKAVKTFQTNNGLAVDGIAGKQTAQTLIKQVSTPSAPAVQPSRGIEHLYLSATEIKDLARLVHGEARGEPFEGQVAVAAVVINRLQSGKFGNSVRQVIFQPGAFTAVSDGQFYLNPNQTSFQAVQAALRGWDPTGGAIYYWNPVTATNKWIWSRPIIKNIGKHVFAH